ncbi:uncharacterized protein ACNS7B_012759 [Menidia menidia]
MMTAGFFLRVPLFAFLIVTTCGAPFKGSKDQSSSGSNAAANFGPYSRRPVASVPYGGASMLPAAHGFGHPALMMAPNFIGSGPRLSGLMAMQTSGVPHMFQTGPEYGSLGSAVPVAYMPFNTGFDTIPMQLGAPQGGMEDAAWAVAPQVLSGMDASGDTWAHGLRDVLPSPPLPQMAPGFQSGETSSVVKEADVGNYQQQTEEMSYPDNRQVSGPRSPTVLVPQFGVRGSLYPNSDYRLMYGQYYPGTYKLRRGKATGRKST